MCTLTGIDIVKCQKGPFLEGLLFLLPPKIEGVFSGGGIPRPLSGDRATLPAPGDVAVDF